MTRTHRLKSHTPDWAQAEPAAPTQDRNPPPSQGPPQPAPGPATPARQATGTERAAQRERDLLLREFSITRDGPAYVCRGNRHAHLDDAVRHAWAHRSGTAQTAPPSAA
jgi:hypothetical protein